MPQIELENYLFYNDVFLSTFEHSKNVLKVSSKVIFLLPKLYFVQFICIREFNVIFFLHTNATNYIILPFNT